MLVDHFPVLGLRVRTPRLELRLPGPDELAALADLAAEGIHPPDRMPFLVPWTAQEPKLVGRSLVQFFWRRMGAWEPDDWGLDLVAFADGEPVGEQTINGRAFAVTREVHTGSWVGRRHQGRGIGTEMRRAVLHLAFAVLGAEVAISGAFSDNDASRSVSRKLGYEPDGTVRHSVRGELAVEQRFRLTRAAWRDDLPVAVEGFEPCRELFGLR